MDNRKSQSGAVSGDRERPPDKRGDAVFSHKNVPSDAKFVATIISFSAGYNITNNLETTLTLVNVYSGGLTTRWVARAVASRLNEFEKSPRRTLFIINFVFADASHLMNG